MTKAMYIGIPNNPTVTLPSGYTQLEYIESTGTQYIDTGFKPNNNTKVVIDFQQLTATANAWWFGARTSASSKNYSFLYIHSNSLRSDYNTSYTQTWEVNATVRRTVIKDAETTTVDGVSQSYTNSSFSCDYNMYLFTVNDKGTAGAKTTGRLYSCQIYDNGTLIRNFIPAKNSSSTIGLYDTVNSKFYTNAGSGTFKAGTALDGKSRARKVNKMYVGIANKPTVTLPSGYTQLEYINGTGTQWMKTGVTASDNSKVEMGFVYESSVNNIIFGASYGYGDFCLAFYNGYLRFHAKGAWKDIDVSTLNSGENHVVLTQTGFTLNGKSYTLSGTTAVRTSEICLFNVVDIAGTTSMGLNPITYFKVYNGTTLLRNLVPAKNSGGTIGMYDIVNNKFYTNVGTGTFVAGKVLDGKGIARKVKKAYIGVNGIARVFFGGLELKYKGTATNLCFARPWLASATVGDYALFAGGAATSYTDAYSSNLTRSTPTVLQAKRNYLAGASVGDYALFAGGANGSTYFYDVDTYNSSLTKSTATALYTKRRDLASANIGDYALFAGGQGASYWNTVDAYNKNLTRSNPTGLSLNKKELAGASVGKYALFAGGMSGTVSNTVDAYDKNLTKTTAPNLSVARCQFTATAVGNYALFGGGCDTSYNYLSTVEVYDSSLTKLSSVTLSVARQYLMAESLGGYAIFAGGWGDDYYDTVDVFDESLTRTTITSLSEEKYSGASATVGNYMLFAGGCTYGDAYTAVVDVFELA